MDSPFILIGPRLEPSSDAVHVSHHVQDPQPSACTITMEQVTIPTSLSCPRSPWPSPPNCLPKPSACYITLHCSEQVTIPDTSLSCPVHGDADHPPQNCLPKTLSLLHRHAQQWQVTIAATSMSCPRSPWPSPQNCLPKTLRLQHAQYGAGDHPWHQTVLPTEPMTIPPELPSQDPQPSLQLPHAQY